MTADSDPPDDGEGRADGAESVDPDADDGRAGADAGDDADANRTPDADVEPDAGTAPDADGTDPSADDDDDGDDGDDARGLDPDEVADDDPGADDPADDDPMVGERLEIDRRSPYDDADPDPDDDGSGVDSTDANEDGGTAGDGDADASSGRTAATAAEESQPVPASIDGDETAGGEAATTVDTTGGASAEAEPATTNGGGGAMTAAQKGMDAVSEGVGALGGDGDGPEADQEMPLAEHIEEMMRRLGAVFAVAGVVVVAVLIVGTTSPAVPSAEEIIAFLWDAHVGFQTNRPRVYGPLEFLLTKLKVASLAGLIVGLPVFVYQTYRFMRPGLYPHERRYYLAAIPTSLVLALVGTAFAHFIVLPAIFNYFISYTQESAVLAFGLRETFNLILLLMGYMAIVFQIPLFIQLAIMMGLVTRRWLEDRRLIFWSAFLGLAFIVSPDPTGMAPIIVGATMIVLFEGTLALLRWTGN